ncbi:hypothetical protein AUC47_04705 [Microbacterium sp. SZ1]|uniref:hypothetical protein n=1 Tax=Microbacterium sp. SZ1 TaxID=1849736 RepID=UPI000BBC095D|nr:hypothetical protein [Microbacterium sp. SZ1]PCE13953.1 hypothetical protein AUC47_04705 [Microbacterium sp. SZ1]
MMLPPIQKIRIASGLLAVALATSSTVANHEASEQDDLDPVSVAELVVPEVLAGAVSDNSEGERVKVPVDPGGGLALASAGGIITVDVPRGDDAEQTVVSDEGIVGYIHGDGSSTVSVPKVGGSVQMLTVIEESGAPERYEYDLTLPEGATAVLNEDGSVTVETGDGLVLAYVAAPWAVDSTGATVPTYYDVRGDTLTQTVRHAGASYPVVADPFWIPLLKIVAQWSKHALKQMAETKHH